MYIVKFIDDTEYVGGPYYDSKWNDMPTKTIKRVNYKLVKQNIVLEGWKGYNHLVERTQFINRTGGIVSKVILMVEAEGLVKKIIYNFITKSVTTEQCNLGEEYNGKPVGGWKVGKPNDNPLIIVL